MLTSQASNLLQHTCFILLADHDWLSMLCSNLQLLVLAVVYLQPFFLYWSRFAHRWFLQIAIITQGLKVYQAYGFPKFNLESLKAWAMQALPSSDFHYLSMALIFLPQPPITMMMVPYVVLAVYHVAAYAAANFSRHPLWQKYGEKAYRWLLANRVS